MERGAYAACSVAVACSVLAFAAPARADVQLVHFHADNFQVVAGPPKASPISDMTVDMAFEKPSQVGGQGETTFFSLLLNGNDQFYIAVSPVGEAQTPGGVDYYTVNFRVPAQNNYYVDFRIFEHAVQVNYVKFLLSGPFREWQTTAVALERTVPSVPEPQAYALMLAGLATVGLAARRKAAARSAL